MTDAARPTFDDWLARVEADLKGKGYASLAWQAEDGFSLPPLQTRTDATDLPHDRESVRALLRRRDERWAVRELVVAGRPEDAAAHARAALAGGADQIEFAFDALVQDAREPTPPRDEPVDDADSHVHEAGPGEGGVAVHDLGAFRRLVDGVDLATTHVSYSAGESSLPVLAYLLETAAERGVDASALRGELDIDPLARLLLRQANPAGDDGEQWVSAQSDPPSVFADAAAQTLACAANCPGIAPLVVDGQSFHLAGASPALELASVLGALTETLRGLAPHGVDAATALGALTVRVQVGHELVPEVGKLRALRALWAKVARAFGIDDATLLRIGSLQCLTSGRVRSQDVDVRTNLLRTTLASVAAVLGNADVVTVLPYDEDPDYQDDSARALAREQQHLLRHESHLDRVHDAAAGSWTLERTTHEIGHAAWTAFREIERRGGLLATMQDGWLLEQLLGHATRRDDDYRRRRRVLVGVTRYADPRLEGERIARTEIAALHGDLYRSHHELVERRVEQDVVDRVEDVVQADRTTLLDAARAAARAGATTAELAMARWPDKETTFAHRFGAVATVDGHEFEDLRANADDYRAEMGYVPSTLLVSFGPPKLAQARKDFARDLLACAGLPTDDPGPIADLDAVRELVVSRRPRALVLCSADPDYAAAIPAVLDTIRTAKLRSPLVLVAGKRQDVPEADAVRWLWNGMDVVEFAIELQEALLV